jgi:hypothetical protein
MPHALVIALMKKKGMHPAGDEDEAPDGGEDGGDDAMEAMKEFAESLKGDDTQAQLDAFTNLQALCDKDEPAPE